MGYIDKFELTIRSSVLVSGTKLNSAYFMRPCVSLAPKWIELAQRVLDAILPSKAIGLLTFVVGVALQSASGKAEVSIVDSNTFRLKWEMPLFCYNEVSDMLIFMVGTPTGNSAPTELTAMPCSV